MPRQTFILPLKGNLNKEEIGNKAHSLLFLQKHRFRIPETYILPGSAYLAYLTDPASTLAHISAEAGLLPNLEYIVRSSTNLEDAEKYSHAGQFKSLPHRKGTHSLISAIKELWTYSHEENSYSGNRQVQQSELLYGVIIQRMIPAILSGVCFSKNPVNDQNEVVVEAVEGPGEALMQKGATPMRWRLTKKEIREGDHDHPWIRIIKEVADAAAKLKRLYGKHIDLEWVHDGDQLFFVQLRSITGEKKVNIYSNKMAQEMLPGQIKPLVWSVNIPMVNSTWINLLSRITGPLNVRPEELAKSFYFRTYFNVRTLGEIFSEFGVPLESLENTMLSESSTHHSFRPGLRTFRHTFRILRFIGYILRFEKFYLQEYQELANSYKQYALKLSGDVVPEEYSRYFQELFEEGKRLAHLNIVIPLLMRIFNRRLSKKMKRIGIDYERLHFALDFPEIETLSPLHAIQRIKESIHSLAPPLKEKCISYKAITQAEGAEHILREMDEFLGRFGHLSESGNDFSFPKWEEDPEFVFRMIMSHTTPARKKNEVVFNEISYSRLLNPGLKSAYQKAGRYRVYREQISSLYIFGYGLFRNLFLKISERLTDEGVLQEKNDIFFLRKPEVDRLLAEDGGSFIGEYNALIRKRKKDLETSRDLILPPVIYGEVAPILDSKDIRNFSGTGTSSGNYTGKTRIVRETKDFSKVEEGDVVIIPFSDVSWTPVLCRAGAIVAESGGMLSHCSIIAREMGIPSLVSVNNACTLPDNILVTVDGSNGILTLRDNE